MFTTSIIGASLLGILVACWNYIKGFLVQLSGRLIGRIEVDYPLANTILPYVVHKYKQSRFSPQKFYSSFEFVRPIGRTQIVAGETINNQGNLFWNKWFPIWISKTFNKDLNENNVSIAYLRGTLNAENFLVSAMDYFNERILEQKTNRFNITNIFGTDGKPANLNIGSGSGIEPSRNSYDYNLAKCSKLLKWNKEDIGQDNRDIGNSVNKLSLNKKALELVKECSRWKNNRDWFRHKGIPWKMGATLYGCPGTGKSALISAIAKDLDMPIFIYSLATLFDDELFKEWKKMLAETPCIAVFEDFDTVFDKRKNIVEGGHLTLDAVLNVIDGIDRPDGLLIFLTTNHIENIDNALIRAGRIDRVIEMTKMDYTGRVKMANRILSEYNNIAIELVEKYTDVTGAEFQLICEQKALELYHTGNEIDQIFEEVNQ